MKMAKYFTEYSGGSVQCQLCPHRCYIKDGHVGICKARVNQGGILYARTYGELGSLAIDPIEKKPLYHFYPGCDILSIGSYGCNFSCLFCQNHEISQNEIVTKYYTPEDLVQIAIENDSIGIAYTYNEPLINIEFVLDTAKVFQDAGLKNVIVTNGFINPEPLADLLPFIDGVNLDIKAGDNAFYNGLCGGDIRPVLDSAKAIVEAGVHLETTTLLIPNENDDADELACLAEWIAENCGRNTVTHLSAYFPRYKLQARDTTEEDLLKARSIFRVFLEYVYCGNMALGSEYSNTYCPACKNELVVRSGYQVGVIGIDIVHNVCSKCGAETDVLV